MCDPWFRNSQKPQNWCFRRFYHFRVENIKWYLPKNAKSMFSMILPLSRSKPSSGTSPKPQNRCFRWFCHFRGRNRTSIQDHLLLQKGPRGTISVTFWAIFEEERIGRGLGSGRVCAINFSRILICTKKEISVIRSSRSYLDFSYKKFLTISIPTDRKHKYENSARKTKVELFTQKLLSFDHVNFWRDKFFGPEGPRSEYFQSNLDWERGFHA